MEPRVGDAEACDFFIAFLTATVSTSTCLLQGTLAAFLTVSCVVVPYTCSCCCFNALTVGVSVPFAALGSADVFQANMIAREMILSMGMGATMGPVDLMHTTAASADAGAMMRKDDPMMPSSTYNFHATDMSTEQVCDEQFVMMSLHVVAHHGMVSPWPMRMCMTLRPCTHAPC